MARVGEGAKKRKGVQSESISSLGPGGSGGLECAYPKGLSWEQTLESITTSVVPQDDLEHCDLQVGNVLCPADL